MQLSIGHRLAGARRARGLSILDVAHKTRISPVNIRNLECDNFAGCPNLVYAKGFLKKLDEFLGAGLGREIASFDTGHTTPSPAVLISVPDSHSQRPVPIAVQVNETRPAFIGLMIGILLVATLPVAAIKWHRSSQPTDTASVNSTETTAPTPPPTDHPSGFTVVAPPHIPHNAPPELAAISSFEDRVDLDELSPPALPATQPVPSSHSSPAVATQTRSRSRSVAKNRPASPPAAPPNEKKKSFFSRLFGSNRN